MDIKKNNSDTKQANNFAKYTGLAFQMLATIGVLSFLGYKIDESRGSEKLIFTALFGVVGVVFSLYQVIRSLDKNQG